MICEYRVSMSTMDIAGALRYLSRRRMQHSNIPPRQDMHARAGFHMPNLNEAGFKCKNVGVRQSKRGRLSLPRDFPIRPGSPSVSIDKKGEIRVAEEKFAIESLNVDRLGVLFACNEIEGGIGLVKERLCF